MKKDERTGTKLRWGGSRAERQAALENLAMLISSGVDPASALDAVARGAKSGQLRKAVEYIKAQVEAGSPLWRALDAVQAFPAHQSWLIRVGEESGTLSEHLATVVGQQRKAAAFRGRLQSALLYPALVLFIGVVVGLSIAWLILPRLVTVFNSLHTTLPILTRILLAIGQFLATSGYWAVPATVVALLLAYYLLFVAEATRWIGEQMLMLIPGLARIIQEIELANFGYVTGSLLSVGVPVSDTLHALVSSGSFRMYRNLYLFLDERITAGQTFAQAFAEYPRSASLFPPTIQQMIITAEQSGKLATTLTQIGATNEERSEVTAKNLTVILEPIFLFIVWIGVVLLAVAIITPVYSLLQGIKK
jgi:type II secretory pathway component PulF